MLPHYVVTTCPLLETIYKIVCLFLFFFVFFCFLKKIPEQRNAHHYIKKQYINHGHKFKEANTVTLFLCIENLARMIQLNTLHAIEEFQDWVDCAWKMNFEQLISILEGFSKIFLHCSLEILGNR